MTNITVTLTPKQLALMDDASRGLVVRTALTSMLSDLSPEDDAESLDNLLGAAFYTGQLLGTLFSMRPILAQEVPAPTKGARTTKPKTAEPHWRDAVPIVKPAAKARLSALDVSVRAAYQSGQRIVGDIAHAVRAEPSEVAAALKRLGLAPLEHAPATPKPAVARAPKGSSDTAIRQCWADGERSAAAIAASVGIKAGTVRAAIKRLGLVDSATAKQRELDDEDGVEDDDSADD